MHKLKIEKHTHFHNTTTMTIFFSLSLMYYDDDAKRASSPVRKIRLFHIACTSTTTRRLPDSRYSSAHTSPSTARGKNASACAWCAAKTSAETGVANSMGRNEDNQG